MEGTFAGHSQEILEAMRIRQEVDAEIQSLYQDRDINDCAGFLLPSLKPNMKLLDCGCGPGQLSSHFAKILSSGSVTGIDANPQHVELAKKESLSQALSNTTFHHGDIYQLPFEDNHFDIAFFHTVICNLHDPIAALQEVKRVVKPGGMIAAREPDYHNSIIYPIYPDVFKGLTALGQAQTGYSDATIGRRLKQIFNSIGLKSPSISASCDTYSTLLEMKKICSYLKAQLLAKEVSKTILERGYLSLEQLEKSCEAFDKLAANSDAIYTYTLIEAIGIV